MAIKILHPHLATDQGFITRFRREALAAARLSHPSIVAVYDTLDEQGVEAIVMELVEGRTLRSVLDEVGLLPPQDVVDIGVQISDALDVAHRAGIVHRDIKPANIMVGNDRRIMVTDFGIAKATKDDDLTHTGTLLGTAKYLAPEQVAGEPVDPRADIYSLGVVLFEAATGEPPFRADTDAATALARLQHDVPRCRDRRPDVPVALDEAIARAMARDPAHRYDRARALRTALIGLDLTRVGPVPADLTDLADLPPPTGLAQVGPDGPPPPTPPPTSRPVPPARPGGGPPPPPPGSGPVPVIRAGGPPPREAGRYPRCDPAGGEPSGASGGPGAGSAPPGRWPSGSSSGPAGGRGCSSPPSGDRAVARSSGPPTRSRSSTPSPSTRGQPRRERPAGPAGHRRRPGHLLRTEGYEGESLAGLKSGVGLILALDGSRELDAIEVAVASEDYWRVEVYVGDGPFGRDGEDFDPAVAGGPVAVLDADSPRASLGGATGSQVLLWVTETGVLENDDWGRPELRHRFVLREVAVA